MRKLAVALSSVLLVGLVAAPALAQNKGTVKVEEVEIDNIPDNSPHPGCAFILEWFQYPEDTEVSWSFTLHPPTSDTSGPGSEIASGAATLGEPDKDEHWLNYRTTAILLEDDLVNSGIEPHPQQGWHIKLTVTGPEGPKHKVFWVECAGYPPRDLGQTGLAVDTTSGGSSGLQMTWGVLAAAAILGALALTVLRRRASAKRSDD